MNQEVEMTEVTDRDNLAVVVRVKELIQIPNKDKIELVKFENFGFDAICEKGHKVGDLVVFIKYDSIVPAIEMFDFMKEFKYRVKQKAFTERDENDEVVKKIYSQGIVIPLGKVEYYLETLAPLPVYILNEGADLTHDLSIRKYIPPVQNGGGSSFGQMQSKGDFPTHIVSKTDEPNLASKVRALDEIQDMYVYITQKLEGSSLTVTWDEDKDELMVCSRNNQIGEHETNKFWQAVNKYDLKTKLKEYPWLVLQGECVGPGIQKNKLGLTEPDMFIFNMSDKRDRRRFTMEEIANMNVVLDTNLVPLVDIIFRFNMTFDQLQELSDKQKYPNGELAEGIVIRPYAPFYSKVLKDVWSVKVINRDYKL